MARRRRTHRPIRWPLLRGVTIGVPALLLLMDIALVRGTGTPLFSAAAFEQIAIRMTVTMIPFLVLLAHERWSLLRGRQVIRGLRFGLFVALIGTAVLWTLIWADTPVAPSGENTGLGLLLMFSPVWLGVLTATAFHIGARSNWT